MEGGGGGIQWSLIYSIVQKQQKKTQIKSMETTIAQNPVQNGINLFWIQPFKIWTVDSSEFQVSGIQVFTEIFDWTLPLS